MRDSYPHSEGRRGVVDGFEVIFGKGRGCRVENDDNPGNVRYCLLKYFQPLTAERGFVHCKTGSVAAWPREARHEAAADRIGNSRENNGNGSRLLQQRRSGGGVMRENKVGLQCDELLRIPSHRLRVEPGPANFYPNIVAVHPSELLKPLGEYRHVGLIRRVALRSRHQDAEAPHPVALLRMRPERSSDCCAAEKGDELAPPHSITSSARPRSGNGIETPSALAVW